MKRYADEPGAESIRRLQDVVVSSLARVEVPAAVARKQRLGELTEDQAAVLVRAFEWDWTDGGTGDGAYAVVEPGETVLALAAFLVSRHPLRAYDAVQLASAVAARDAEPELARFACFDGQLASAARAEGFTTLP